MSKSDTSRQNGAKSKGPKTAEGKRRSALNATKHGLNSKLVMVNGEHDSDYDVILKELLDHFQPVGPVENRLVNTLANAEWRQNRLWAYEASLINNRIENDRDNVDREWNHIEPHDRAALAFERLNNWEKAFPQLTRHEAALRRAYHKALKDLKDEQKERRSRLGSFSQFSQSPEPRPPVGEEPPAIPIQPASPPEPQSEPASQPAANISNQIARFTTGLLLLLILKAAARRRPQREAVPVSQPSPLRASGRQERIVPAAPTDITPSVRYVKEKCSARGRCLEDK